MTRPTDAEIADLIRRVLAGYTISELHMGEGMKLTKLGQDLTDALNRLESGTPSIPVTLHAPIVEIERVMRHLHPEDTNGRAERELVSAYRDLFPR